MQSRADTSPWLALSSAPLFSIRCFASSLRELLWTGVIYILHLQSSRLQWVFGEAEAEVQLRQPWKRAHLHASPGILWDVASARILATRLRLFPTPVLQIWELVRCLYRNKARGKVADHRPSLEIYNPRLGLHLSSPTTCIKQTKKTVMASGCISVLWSWCTPQIVRPRNVRAHSKNAKKKKKKWEKIKRLRGIRIMTLLLLFRHKMKRINRFFFLNKTC